MMIELYLISVAVAISLATTIVCIFIIRRRSFFAKYIKESNLPFVPIQSYIKGSIDLVLSPTSDITDKMIGYMKSYDADTLGIFYGPYPIIYTKDLDLIKKIWITDSQKHINRPNLLNVITLLNDSIFLAKDDHWRRVRRGLGSNMTPSKLREWNLEQDVDACVNKLMLSLTRQLTVADSCSTERQSTIVDATKICKDLTMDIGLESNLRQSNKIDYDLGENEIVSLGDNIIKQISSTVVMWTMYLPPLVPIVAFLARLLNYTKFFLRFERSVKDILIENAKSRGATMDKTKLKVVDSLLELYNQKKISKKELIANSCLMVIANWGSTSDTLAAIMWHLAKYPNIQEKLRQDIIKNNVESQYLSWTLKEVLRLHPPATTLRIIGEDFTWKGYKIMKGMNFNLSHFLVRKDATIWGDDASEFKPERFERSDQFHIAQYCPFGLGPRNCVGYYSAMAILKNFTIRLLLDFSVELCQDTPDELKLKPSVESAFFLHAIKNPLPIKLTKLID